MPLKPITLSDLEAAVIKFNMNGGEEFTVEAHSAHMQEFDLWVKAEMPVNAVQFLAYDTDENGQITRLYDATPEPEDFDDRDDMPDQGFGYEDDWASQYDEPDQESWDGE